LRKSWLSSRGETRKSTPRAAKSFSERRQSRGDHGTGGPLRARPLALSRHATPSLASRPRDDFRFAGRIYRGRGISLSPRNLKVPNHAPSRAQPATPRRAWPLVRETTFDLRGAFIDARHWCKARSPSPGFCRSACAWLFPFQPLPIERTGIWSPPACGNVRLQFRVALRRPAPEIEFFPRQCRAQMLKLPCGNPARDAARVAHGSFLHPSRRPDAYAGG
jgi:hypothetical protein